MKRYFIKQLTWALIIAILMPLVGIAEESLPLDVQQVIFESNDVVIGNVGPDPFTSENSASTEMESEDTGETVFSDDDNSTVALDMEAFEDEVEEANWVDLTTDEGGDVSDADVTDEKQDAPFDQTVEVGEVSIRVTADPDSFPDGAFLWAEEINDESIINVCGDMLELKDDCTHHSYRIEVRDASGNAILPYEGSQHPIVHVNGLKKTDDVLAVCYDPTIKTTSEINTLVVDDTIEFAYMDSAFYDIVMPVRLEKQTLDEQYAEEIPSEDEHVKDEFAKNEHVENSLTENNSFEIEAENNREINESKSDDEESISAIIEDIEDSSESEILLIDEESVLSGEQQSSQEEVYSALSSPTIESTQNWSDFAEALSNLIQEYDGKTVYGGGNRQFEAGLSEDVFNAYASARLIVWVQGELQDIPEEYNVRAIIRDPENHYFLQFDNPIDAKHCSDYLLTLSNISYIEPDGIVYGEDSANNSTDEVSFHSWGVKATHADEYAKYLKKKGGNTSVIVAVVDSGIYSGNELFLGRLVPGYDFVSNDNNPEASGDHGTHVAGTIAECTMGLNIRIMPIRVLKKNIFGETNGSNSTAAQGIRFAANSNVNVINLSIGGGHSEYLDEAVQYAIGKGITVVAAAGNKSDEVSNHCPAHNRDCITVSAVDSNMCFWADSNYGVDISAPGVNISGASGGGFVIKHGTSMAAPHVSAAAAMLLYETPSYSPDQIKTLLRTNATDLGTSGWDPYFGAGFLNLRPFVKENSPSIPSNSIISFNDVEYPDPYVINTRYGWPLAGGTVYSNAGLKTLKSELLYNNSQKAILSVYGPIDISGNSYPIKSINYGVKFSQITQPGNYIWRLTATDNTGKTESYEMYFTAQKPESSTIDVTPPDTEKPVISDISISDLDSTGYTVTCTVTDNVGVTRVSFPTSQLYFISIGSNNNGGEEGNYVEYEGTLSGNKATVRVNLNDFVDGSREFTTNIYAFDAAGNIAWAFANESKKVDEGSYLTTPIVIPKAIAVSSIKLNSSSMTIEAGTTGQLIASIEPGNATNQRVTWSSGNPSVATVNNGLVTAVNEGTVTITCTAADGSGVKASCSVTVVNGVRINENSFPDTNFRQYVSNYIDKDHDGFLSEAERLNVKKLVLNYQQLENARGIELFPNITELEINDNYLVELDLSNNNKIKRLYCNNNKLKRIVLRDVSELTSLECYGNELEYLDISANKQLIFLKCRNNKLIYLDVSHNCDLYSLNCSGNQLRELNLLNNPELTHLHCDNNQLENIDITNNLKLYEFTCSSNKLSTLRISHQPKLGWLECFDNAAMTSLYIDNNDALISVDCQRNRLTNLTIKNNPKLSQLYCYDNNLAFLDVSGNIGLKRLNCYNNQLETLIFGDSINLVLLNCAYNKLSDLNIENMADLITLYCSNNQLKTLKACNNPLLRNLDCRRNQLTTIDIHNDPALRQLLCNNNRLTQVDIIDSSTIASHVNEKYYKLSEDRKLVSYEEYIDRKNNDSDTSHTYLACDSSVTIIGGEPVAPYSEPASTTSSESEATVVSAPDDTSSNPVLAPIEPAITIPQVPSSVKAKVRKTKVTVSWKRIKTNKKGKALLKTIKSIEVQYSTDPMFATNVVSKTVGKKKTKITLKLQSKTQYYIRVRYVGIDGGISNWSAVKKVKTKK